MARAWLKNSLPSGRGDGPPGDACPAWGGARERDQGPKRHAGDIPRTTTTLLTMGEEEDVGPGAARAEL